MIPLLRAYRSAKGANLEPVNSGRLTGLLRILHATKAEVIAAGADFTFATRTDHVARAVLVGAKEGTAAMDAFFLGRFGWIIWSVRSNWIASDFAEAGEFRVVIRPVPVGAP